MDRNGIYVTRNFSTKKAKPVLTQLRSHLYRRRNRRRHWNRRHQCQLHRNCRRPRCQRHLRRRRRRHRRHIGDVFRALTICT